MRWVKPIDEARLRELATIHPLWVTLEENAIAGGAGSAVLEFVAAEQLDIDVLCLGLPDHFVDHGDQATLLADCGLDAAGIERAIATRLKIKPSEHIAAVPVMR